MIKAEAVIGANFGDEGKGLMVDYFASRSVFPKPLIIKFNGGAQARHTVELANGVRCVFSHFGSGTFNGADTLLSRFFVVHPMVFDRELVELQLIYKKHPELGRFPALHVDQRCLVVTPYDVLLNQVIETSRGLNRLGSTGLGVSEAMIRSSDPKFRLMVNDLSLFKANKHKAQRQLLQVRDLYVPARLASAGVDIAKFPSELKHLYSQEALDNFIDDCLQFCWKTVPVDERMIKAYGHVIFEGAQGLLLDRATGTFPHVTSSRTGITNVFRLCEAINQWRSGPVIEEVEVTYVTRPYVTRHGAGPLEREIEPIGRDETNLTNEHQGNLRYGTLDVGYLQDRIQADLRQVEPTDVRLRPALAVTCADQVEPDLQLERHGQLYAFNGEAINQRIAQAVGLPRHYVASGRTCETVKLYNEEDK